MAAEEQRFRVPLTLLLQAAPFSSFEKAASKIENAGIQKLRSALRFPEPVNLPLLFNCVRVTSAGVQNIYK